MQSRQWLIIMLAWLLPVAHFDVARAGSTNDFELGISGVSGGDDHADPALLLRGNVPRNIFVQSLIYGADFGPVSARTLMLSAGTSGTVKNWDKLRFHYGLTVMDEYISIYSGDRRRPDDTTQPKVREHNYNFGGVLGLRYQLLQRSKFTFNVGWESHLFLAGSAGIFLVMGVKQAWYGSVGVDL